MSTHIGDACRAAGLLPIAMALKCTKLDRSGRARIADFCHRLLSTLPWTPHIHLAIFVHRVKDLPAGLYLFVRDASQTRALRAAFTKVDKWESPETGVGGEWP